MDRNGRGRERNEMGKRQKIKVEKRRGERNEKDKRIRFVACSHDNLGCMCRGHPRALGAEVRI